jgi:DNA ligase (NAD+)
MTANKQRLFSEIFNEQDFLAFDKDIREALEETAELQYVVEPRITGVEAILIYEQGTLKSVTDQAGPVTPSVKTILTVPLTFIPLRKETPVPSCLEIVADIYMEEAAFAQLNQEMRMKHLATFSDPRAAVEDSLHQTDARISAKRPMNYFCSGIGKKAEVKGATHYEIRLALQELGLRVNRPHIQLRHGMREVIDHCRSLRAEAGNFPYPVEGALIRVNSLDLQERLSRISGHRTGTAVFRF